MEIMEDQLSRLKIEESGSVEVVEPVAVAEGTNEVNACPGPSKSSEENDQGPGPDGCKIRLEVFQELIRKRKEDKMMRAKEARLAELGRIVEMKSATETHPVELFPKEIWIMILEKLKNPQDLANMSKIHELFSALLEDNLIPDILLPLVLDYKIPLLERAHAQRLPLWDLMILRRVSKRLRDAVDRQIEDHIMHSMKNLESPDILNSVRFKMMDDEHVLDQILIFSRGPVTERPKRFFLRSLKVVFSPHFFAHWVMNDRERRQGDQVFPQKFFILKENINELLEKVGDQILHFNLELCGIQSMIGVGVPLSLKQIYDILRQWLVLMPNLKWLVLSADELGDLPKKPNWIEGSLENQSIPRLDQLERLDLWGCSGFPIWDPVLSSNQHINYCIYQPDKSYVDTTRHQDHVGAVTKTNDLPFHQKISVGNWNLKGLKLELDLMDSPVTVESVFRSLDNVPTLEDLSIKIDHVTFGKINFLQLPNLKKFKLLFGPVVNSYEDGAFFFSLQFLLHCSKLESLVWENLMHDSLPIWHLMEPLGEKEGILMEFKGGKGNLRGSNIWNVFPKLRCIKVKFRQGIGCVSGKELEYRDRNLVHEKW